MAVVTDRRIIVLYTGRLTLGMPKTALYQLPRETTIGPTTGLWWKCTTLGANLYVHKRVHKTNGATPGRTGDDAAFSLTVGL